MLLQRGPTYHDVIYATVVVTTEWKSDFKLTIATPYLAVTGELWGVFYENLKENWLQCTAKWCGYFMAYTVYYFREFSHQRLPGRSDDYKVPVLCLSTGCHDNWKATSSCSWGMWSVGKTHLGCCIRLVLRSQSNTQKHRLFLLYTVVLVLITGSLEIIHYFVVCYSNSGCHLNIKLLFVSVGISIIKLR